MENSLHIQSGVVSQIIPVKRASRAPFGTDSSPKRHRLTQVYRDSQHGPLFQFTAAAVGDQGIYKPVLQPISVNTTTPSPLANSAHPVNMSSTTTHSRAKEGKENKNAGEEDTQSPPPTGPGEDGDTPITSQVMSLFTTSWQKFTADFETDLTTLIKTVGDSKGGLVK